MRPILSGRAFRITLLAAIMAAAAVIIILAVDFWTRSSQREGASGFDGPDRLRYRAALEKLRYELRAGPGAIPFEQAMTEADLQAAIAEDEKKERLLREQCGLEITAAMIEQEYERLKEDPGDTRVLAGIVEALDRDPAALIQFWLRPTLVDRYLRACVAVDERQNGPARSWIEDQRQQGPPASAVVEFNLKSAELEPEDRDALAAAAAGSMTTVVESPTDFHFFFVESRTGDTVRARPLSSPKPEFDDWLKSQP